MPTKLLTFSDLPCAFCGGPASVFIAEPSLPCDNDHPGLFTVFPFCSSHYEAMSVARVLPCLLSYEPDFAGIWKPGFSPASTLSWSHG